MMRRLREIEARDLSRLARLHAECFPDDRWDARALAELLAMAGASGRLVEETPTAPIGFLLDLLTGDQVEILTLCVASAARRQGVALLLLDDLFARARAAEARSVTLEVAADNLPARRLYEGCGFSATGQRPSYYRRGAGAVDALLLRRTLLG